MYEVIFMKKILGFVSIILLSGCAAMFETQLYEGPPKLRSEVSVFTTHIPKDYWEKHGSLKICGGIREIGDRFFPFSPQTTIELLPGTYRYKWDDGGQYIKTYGEGNITVGKNEVHVLVCDGDKFGVIKMPYKLTETEINVRKKTK
jgi:hypothetical protein